MSANKCEFYRIAPQFVVPDVRQSDEYYRDKYGCRYYLDRNGYRRYK
jgi:hypothetical protein